MIAKFATEHAATRQLLAAFAGYAREVRFYREIASRIGISTPRCFFAHYDRAEGEFLLLLEDLSPASTVDMEQGLSLAQAELVLDQLAEMHARFWQRVDGLDWLQLSPELVVTMRDRFVVALPKFAARYGARYPEIARAGRYMAVLLADAGIMAQVRRAPLTLAHNDVHVNNLLLPGAAGGRFALIDWQSITVSRHGTTDVARVLGVCITPELRRKSGRALLGYYHARLRARGVRGYGRLALEFRLRQEMTAMVIVGVLAYDTLDFAGEHGERTADSMGARIEAAIADARVSSLLGALVVWLRCKRWLKGVFGARRQIGPG
jgi:aminoglycoside/choline kinase family phosphotransferase